MRWAAIALVACLLAAPAFAQENNAGEYHTGWQCDWNMDSGEIANCRARVRVIDGDTFELDGEEIRLWGIDAPEIDQRCYGWSAGEDARRRLFGFTAAIDRCEPIDTGPDGRTTARCFDMADRDIGSLMVERGYAWEDTRISDGYYARETEIAAMQRDAVSVLDCDPPWEWRGQNPR